MKTKFKIRFFFTDEYNVHSSLYLEQDFSQYPADARIGTELKKFKNFCDMKGYKFKYAKVEKIYC